MEYPPWKPQSTLIVADKLISLFNKHRILALHCGASWDLHDTTYDGILQEVKKEWGDRVGFYAMDIDDERNSAFCRNEEFMNIPVLLLFVDEVRKEMLFGVRSKEQVGMQLQSIFAEIENSKQHE